MKRSCEPHRVDVASRRIHARFAADVLKTYGTAGGVRMECRLEIADADRSTRRLELCLSAKPGSVDRAARRVDVDGGLGRHIDLEFDRAGTGEKDLEIGRASCRERE